MQKRKYTKADIDKLANKEATPQEIADKYGVNVQCVYRLCERECIHFYKPIIKIHSPYKDIYVKGKQECAEELHISYSSVKNALNGKRVKILEELNITLSYVDKRQ